MTPSPRLQQALITSAGLAAILVAVFTRTTGIHFDELNYMIRAGYEVVGDVARTGKPYLFYVVNYAVLHLVPEAAGGLRPASLHLFYATLCVVSLAWLVSKATDTTGQFAWHFAMLLGAPFFVFNSTQVMMETAVIPCLTLAVGAVIDIDRRGSRRSTEVLLFVASTLALLFKETAIVGLVILLAAFWPRVGRRLWPLALGIVFGVGLGWVMLRAVQAPPHNYGGVSTLLDPNVWPARLKLTREYVSMWAFFVWPVTLAGVVVMFARGLYNDSYDRALLYVGGLSLAGTIAIQAASNYELARYAYPAIWLGVIAFAFLLVRRAPRWLAALSLLLYAVPIANMWRSDPLRFNLWPSFIANEAHYSSYGVLPGVRNIGWLAFAGNRRENMCVFVARGEGADGPEWLERYFAGVTVNPRFFDETQFGDFKGCDGPKAYLRKQQEVFYRCGSECPRSQYSERVCSVTEDRFTSPGQMLTNLTCLP